MNQSPFRHPDHLTAGEIGLFLGITAATVRSLVMRYEIRPVGKEGRANLYDARAFVDMVGSHDRRYVRKRRGVMQH